MIQREGQLPPEEKKRVHGVLDFYTKEQPLHDSLNERKTAEIEHLMKLQKEVSKCFIKEGLNQYIKCRKITEEYGYYVGARNYIMTGEDFWKPNHNIKMKYRDWDPSQATEQIESFPEVTAENPKKRLESKLFPCFQQCHGRSLRNQKKKLNIDSSSSLFVKTLPVIFRHPHLDQLHQSSLAIPHL